MYDHHFEAIVDRHGVGKTRKVWYSVIFLPADIARGLPFKTWPRLRVEGEIADVPVSGAWIPAGDGRHYFIVGPRVFKDAGVGIGDLVEMRFAIADQTAVDLPDELQRALAIDAAAQQAWQALTAGKRRGWAHLVHAAKTPPTRARRVGEVIAALTGDDPGGGPQARLRRQRLANGSPDDPA